MSGYARVAGTGALVMAAVALVLSAGCGGEASYRGDERASVSGSVTLDGKPLPYGNILFMGQGKMASAMIDNGTYSIAEGQGPNLGEYTVQITGSAQAPPKAGDSEAEDASKVDADNASAGEQIVPAQYNSKSTLKVTIAAGKNTHDFTLTTK